MTKIFSIPVLCLIGLTALSSALFAKNADTLKVSRYGHISLSPHADETDVLSVIVEVQFPSEIRKVGDALAFLLQNSGYRLEDPEIAGRHQYALYQFDLPEVHRNLGPMTLWDALTVLGNGGFVPEANPLLRTVRFELNAQEPFTLGDAEIACARDKWLHRDDPDYVACADKTNKQESEPIQYGPVRHGEALYRIAESLKIDGPAIEQVMVAIFHTNPEAFGGNINVLLEGTTLTIPDVETIEGTDLDCAKQLVRAHIQQWQQDRQENRHE